LWGIGRGAFFDLPARHAPTHPRSVLDLLPLVLPLTAWLAVLPQHRLAASPWFQSFASVGVPESIYREEGIPEIIFYDSLLRFLERGNVLHFTMACPPDFELFHALTVNFINQLTTKTLFKPVKSLRSWAIQPAYRGYSYLLFLKLCTVIRTMYYIHT
jgi:hypothetical protein